MIALSLLAGTMIFESSFFFESPIALVSSGNQLVSCNLAWLRMSVIMFIAVYARVELRQSFIALVIIE